VLHLSSAMLLSHLSLNFRQLVKDRQILAAEVMKEYDKKFVYKKIVGGKVDRGVQTSQGEFFHHRSRCEPELICGSRDDLLGFRCQHHAWLSSICVARPLDPKPPLFTMNREVQRIVCDRDDLTRWRGADIEAFLAHDMLQTVATYHQGPAGLETIDQHIL
jgi:hypothetical protein